MTNKRSLKIKLLQEYKNVCWAIGYWQRRHSLATTDVQQTYCYEGLQRNQNLKLGLELALKIAKVSTIAECTAAMADGIAHVDAIYCQ